MDFFAEYISEIKKSLEKGDSTQTGLGIAQELGHMPDQACDLVSHPGTKYRHSLISEKLLIIDITCLLQ